MASSSDQLFTLHEPFDLSSRIPRFDVPGQDSLRWGYDGEVIKVADHLWWVTNCKNGKTLRRSNFHKICPKLGFIQENENQEILVEICPGTSLICYKAPSRRLLLPTFPPRLQLRHEGKMVILIH